MIRPKLALPEQCNSKLLHILKQQNIVAMNQKINYCGSLDSSILQRHKFRLNHYQCISDQMAI